MAYLVLLIVLVVIAYLLYQSVQDARRRAAGGGAPPPRESTSRRAAPKPRREPRPPKTKVDQEALSAHVEKLRDAIANDLISMDEAVASVVRQTDGAVSTDAARKLLRQGPAGS
jgi:hypothetical protein